MKLEIMNKESTEQNLVGNTYIKEKTIDSLQQFLSKAKKNMPEGREQY
jgi:hypothetical protein